MVVHLRVILEEHDIRKLTLPTGIPNTVEDLVAVVGESFQLQGEFGLLYEDKDFGNQFFSVTSTADLYDKATVKVIRKETVFTLDLHPVDASGLSSPLSSPSSLDTHPASSDVDTYPPDVDTSMSDCASSSSKDTIILP